MRKQWTDRERTRQSDSEAGEHDTEALRNDHPHYRSTFGAQRDTDPDLVSP
jgi:hypothetical protein